MDKRIYVTRDKAVREGRWSLIETNFSMKEMESLNFPLFVGGVKAVEFSNFKIWVQIDESTIIRGTIEMMLKLIFEILGFTCEVQWGSFIEEPYKWS